MYRMVFLRRHAHPYRVVVPAKHHQFLLVSIEWEPAWDLFATWVACS
jgi:hypothetical protein